MKYDWQPFEMRAGRMTDVKDCAIYGAIERKKIKKVYVVSDNKILLLDLYDNAECIDTSTGKSVWSLSDAKNKIKRVTIVEGIIYCAVGSANIGAFDSDGNKLWTQNVSDSVAELTVKDGILYAHTYSQAICVDAKTGEALWRTKLNANTKLSRGLLSESAYMIPYIPKKGGKQVIGFLNTKTGAIEKELLVAEQDYNAGFVDGNVAWWTPGRYYDEYQMIDTEARLELPGRLKLDNGDNISEERIADMQRYNGRNLAVLVVKDNENKIAVRVCGFSGNDFITILPSIGSTGAFAYNNNDLCLVRDSDVQVFNLLTGEKRTVAFDASDRDLEDVIAAADGTVFVIQKGDNDNNILYAVK